MVQGPPSRRGCLRSRFAGALEALCRAYWPPLYSFLRRQGHSPHDAEDLVQGFLARLLAREDLAEVGPEKGRFRTFLLTSLRNFVIKQALRDRAVKRGGGRSPFPSTRRKPNDCAGRICRPLRPKPPLTGALPKRLSLALLPRCARSIARAARRTFSPPSRRFSMEPNRKATRPPPPARHGVGSGGGRGSSDARAVARTLARGSPAALHFRRRGRAGIETFDGSLVAGEQNNTGFPAGDGNRMSRPTRRQECRRDESRVIKNSFCGLIRWWLPPQIQE